MEGVPWGWLLVGRHLVGRQRGFQGVGASPSLQGEARREPEFVQRVENARGQALQEVGSAQGVRGGVVGAWCSRKKALGWSCLLVLQLGVYLVHAGRCPRTGERWGATKSWEAIREDGVRSCYC